MNNINVMIIISQILGKIMIVMMRTLLLKKKKKFIKVFNTKKITNNKTNIIPMKTQHNNLKITLYIKVSLKRINIL